MNCRAGTLAKIPAGSKLVFQMHYTPNGVEQSDVTRVGLLTCDASQVKQEVFTLMAIDQEFEIPPGVENYSVRASTRWLPAGAELLAITPHMHFRGKSFRLFGAVGESEMLLHVPNYDFNWQHTYQLQQPLPLDAFESGLQFEAVFDNSTHNPFNPDPTQIVTWGDQSWEEMAVAFFEVARPRQAHESSHRASTQGAQGIDLTEQQRAAKQKRTSKATSNWCSPNSTAMETGRFTSGKNKTCQCTACTLIFGTRTMTRLHPPLKFAKLPKSYSLTKPA